MLPSLFLFINIYSFLLNNYDFFSRSMYISLQCNDQQYTNFYKSFAFLDSPSINWKTIIVGFTIGQYVFETYLDLRQYRVLQLKTAPKSIEKKFHKKHSTNPKSIPVLKHSFQSFPVRSACCRTWQSLNMTCYLKPGHWLGLS